MGSCTVALLLATFGSSPAQATTLKSVLDVVRQSADAVKNCGPQKTDCRDPEPTKKDDAQGCLKMARDFCEKLYGGDDSGNLVLGHPPDEFQIRLGQNDKGMDHSLATLLGSRLKNKDRLPQDFAKALESAGYFDAIKKYLDTPDPDTQNYKDKNKELEARVAYKKLVDKVAYLWNTSYEETILRRNKGVDAKHHKATAKATLDQQISEATWGESAPWKRVQKDAESVRKAYLATIDELPGLDKSVKEAWKKKISATKVVLPDTDKLKVDYDAGCSTTEVQALHFSSHNYVTVCAGIFNGEDPLATLAHEFSHGLDPNSLIEEASNASPLGVAMRELGKSTCDDDNRMSCERWQKWKAGFPSLLAQPDPFKPLLPKYYDCLMDGNVPGTPPSAAALEKRANEATIAEIDKLATDGAFLKLAKEKMTYSDGSIGPNNYQYDPCWLNGPKDFSDFTSNSVENFFVNEYRCSSESSPTTRLDKAIAFARDSEIAFKKTTLSWGGRYSDDTWMVRSGYAKEISERFADDLGMRVLAKALSAEPSLEKRRNLFLAGSADVCESPGLDAAYPEESAVERKYSSEPHSVGLKRIQETLNEPLRLALGCKKDFEQTECTP